MASSLTEPVTAKYLTLGTMRFLEVERSRAEWLGFLRSARDSGVVALHSSSEYESFPLLQSLLGQAGTAQPDLGYRHIAKLAEPSFDDAGFSGQRLTEKVLAYCVALSTPILHDVQWMWRQGLGDDVQRRRDFAAALDDIGRAVSDLKRQGLIERFLCFAYSPAFAEAAIAHEAIDGLVAYRNMRERDYDAAIARCGALGKVCHIIRPFDAGAALTSTDQTPEQLLRSAIDMPAIETAIVSSNSKDHLAQLAAAIGSAR